MRRRPQRDRLVSRIRVDGGDAERPAVASHSDENINPSGSQLAMRGIPLKVIQELMGHVTIEMTEWYAYLSPDTRRERPSGFSTGPLRPRATYEQHGWRKPLIIHKDAVKKWRRRESNPPLEASGESAPERLRAVSVGLPAGYTAHCPTPSCVESAPARTCCSNVVRHVAAALEPSVGITRRGLRPSFVSCPRRPRTYKQPGAPRRPVGG